MRISDWSSDVCSSDLRLRHLPQVQAMSGQPIRIGLDLELTHLATDAGNFRNARHALQFVLEEEILQRAQFINIVTVMSIDQRIFEYPADTRCIRPQCREDRKSTRLNSSH